MAPMSPPGELVDLGQKYLSLWYAGPLFQGTMLPRWRAVATPDPPGRYLARGLSVLAERQLPALLAGPLCVQSLLLMNK